MPLPATASFFRIWLCAWVAVCLLLVGCQRAETTSESSQLKSKQWWMDKSGQATLSDAQAATGWQPLPEWKSWGYGPETIWVRLDLRSVSHATASPWVVQVRPPYLDYVTLYDPVNGLEQRSGDALPPHDSELASINLTFLIPAMDRERSVYLKVQSISTRVLHVEVMPYGVAQQKNRTQEWLIGAIIALSAIFSIWALAQWFYTRDPVMGAFAIKEFVATAWGFLMLGFARVAIGPWFSEGGLSSFGSTSFLSMIPVTLWFLTLLNQTYGASRNALRACYGLAALLVFLPAGVWLGQPYLTLIIGNFCIPLFMSLLIITLLTAWRSEIPHPIPIKFMLLYLCSYGTLSGILPLIHLGLIDASLIGIFGTLAYTVFDGIIMFTLLQFRARSLQKDHQKITQDLLRSQEKTLVEARHREEQSQLFAMLAHEMKTPLATLRMWMDAGQLKRDAMERAITDMNQVIERCVHTGQLADQGLEAVSQRVSPAELTRNCILVCRAPERVGLTAPTTDNLLHTDAQMLSIVLGNLLDNACKYGAPNSRIQVSLTTAQENGRSGWRWRVANLAGPVGLPEVDRLFEKYYRSPQARRLSGSGLGLFLVKGLLNLLQGSIHYASEGDHAVFSVWVPIHPIER
jgi:two-component system, sensor histidine kinase LadS